MPQPRWGSCNRWGASSRERRPFFLTNFLLFGEFYCYEVGITGMPANDPEVLVIEAIQADNIKLDRSENARTIEAEKLL